MKNKDLKVWPSESNVRFKTYVSVMVNTKVYNSFSPSYLCINNTIIQSVFDLIT